jgi:hypothetical protein
MREDVKDLLDRAAGWYEPRTITPEDMMRRSARQRRAGRVATAAVAFAVFAAAGALVWSEFAPVRPTPGTLAGSNVLEVPPRGAAEAAFLSDGRPVFVVHYGDGSVAVLDAFSQHPAWGIEQLAVWCSAKHYFVALPAGSYFDKYGGWTAGSPAPPGLRSFTFDVVRRDSSGDAAVVRAGAIGLPIAHQHGNLTSRPSYASPPCGPADGSPSPLVAHTVDPSRIWDSPAEAVQASTSDWMAVEGTLLVPASGPVAMCSDIAGDVCRDRAPVLGIDAAGLRRKIESDPDSPYAQSHVWLVRTQDGAIVELAIGYEG